MGTWPPFGYRELCFASLLTGWVCIVDSRVACRLLSDLCVRQLLLPCKLAVGDAPPFVAMM
eukprot:1157466-Pelagomonas_calceolata.AAC.2